MYVVNNVTPCCRAVTAILSHCCACILLGCSPKDYSPIAVAWNSVIGVGQNLA